MTNLTAQQARERAEINRIRAHELNNLGELEGAYKLAIEGFELLTLANQLEQGGE